MATALQAAKLDVANKLVAARDNLNSVRSSIIFNSQEAHDIVDVVVWIDNIIGHIITNEPINIEK